MSEEIRIEVSGSVNNSLLVSLEKVSKAINENLIKAMQGYNLPSARNSAFVQYFKEVDKNLKVEFSSIQKSIDNLFKSGTSKANVPSARNSALVDYYREVDRNLKVEFRNTQKTIDDFFRNATSRGGNTPLPTASTSMFEAKPTGLAGMSAAIPALGQIAAMVTAANQLLEIFEKIWDRVATAATVAWEKILRPGLAYNDLIESSKLGIAGIVYQLTDVYKAQNLVTDSSEKWTGSLQISEEITKELQNAALMTKAVYQDLARGMQEGFAPFLQMGGQQDQLTPFVTRFIHLMSTLRIPLREIGQEIRAFSNLETNPRTARASFAIINMVAKEMGVSLEQAKAKLNEFKNDNTLVDWFLRNSEGFQKSGMAQMGTLSGILSNLKELIDRVLGEGTQALYNQLKDNLDTIVDSFIKFDEEGNAAFSPGLIRAIEDVATVAGFLADKFTTAVSWAAKFLDIREKILSAPKIAIDFVFNEPPQWVKTLLSYNLGKFSGAPAPGFMGSFSGKQSNNIDEELLFDSLVKGNRNKSFSQIMAPLPYRFKNDPSLSTQYEKGFDEQVEAFEKHKKKAAEEAERAAIKVADSIRHFVDEWTNSFERNWQEGIKKSERRLTDWLSTWSAQSSAEQLKPKHDKEWEDFKSQYPNLFGNLEENWKAAAEQAGQVLLKEINKEWNDEAMSKKAEIFNNKIQTFWTGPMTSIFAELGTTGGRNFMQVMARNFDSLVSNSAEQLANMFGSLLGLSNVQWDKDAQKFATYDKYGKPTYIGEDELRKRESRQKNIDAAMSLASVGLGSYASGRTGQKGSVTAGVIGGAMTGLTIGGPTYFGAIMAVIGAIVGGLSAALGKAAARDEYKYALPVISNRGVVSLTPGLDYKGFGNINEQERKELTTRIQEQFDKFWVGYINIATQFGAKVLPRLSQIYGNFQQQASANFLKHLDAWINGDLPDMIQGMFKETFTALAKGFGMTEKEFSKWFDKIGALDPSKALELFNILFNTLQNFQKIQTSRPTSVDLGGFTGSGFNLMVGQESIQKPMWEQFKDTDEKLRNLVAQFGALSETGPTESQLRIAQEISNLTLDRMEAERELAREIAQFLKDSALQFNNLRQQYTLEQMGTLVTDEKTGEKTWKPDYQKQIDYLADYLDKVKEGIANSTNTEQLQFWQSEFFKTIQQMGGIYQQQGPENYQAFLEWVNGKNGEGGILSEFQTAIQARIAAIGEMFDSEWSNIFAVVKPVIDTFTGQVTDGGNSIRDLIPAIKDLIPPMRELRDEVKNIVLEARGLRRGGGNLIYEPEDDTSNFELSVASRRY